MALIPVYRQASFKGIEFNVDETAIESGRNVVIHRYVNQDVPYAEDMRRKEERYSFQAYIIGEDHLTLADRFLTVLNQRGAGLLVLPNRVTQTVVCTEVTRTDDTRNDKRRTVFDLAFIEAGEFLFPGGAFAQLAELIGGVDTAIAQVINNVVAPVESFVAGVNRVVEAANNVQVTITNGVSRVGTSFDILSTLFDGFQTSSASAPEVLDALLDMEDFTSAVAPVVGGPVAQAEFAQAQNFDNSFRTLAVLNAAKASASLTFSNRREALQYRDRIYDQFDAVLQSQQTDTAVNLVIDSQRQFMANLTANIAILPTYAVVDMGAQLPSVVAAHRLFGDYTREADLRTWNPTQHPLFMSRYLEVIR